MLSPVSSVNTISALTESSINLLLGTRSVERLKMNKHAPHTTRVPACPADSGQTAFRCCSQRVLCSGISGIKRTSPRRRARRPLARRCWRDSSGGSGDGMGTGRDGDGTRTGMGRPRGQRPDLPPPPIRPDAGEKSDRKAAGRRIRLAKETEGLESRTFRVPPAIFHQKNHIPAGGTN